MKNRNLIIVPLLLLLVGCSSNSSSSSINEEPQESLLIEDYVVSLSEEATILTNISDEFKNDISYSFEGESISIENGIVKGLIPYTSTLVSASYKDLKTTFKVDVNYETFGKNVYSKEGDNNFILQQDYSFVDLGNGDSISYLYSNNEAVAGQSFAVSGTLTLFESSLDGLSTITFSNDSEEKIEYIIRYNSLDSYSLYSKVSGGEEISTKFMSNFDTPIINFFIIFNQGKSYFYVNDKFLGGVNSQLNRAHIGFSSTNTKFKLERIHSSSNIEMINSILDDFNNHFGAHATGDAEIHSNMFRDLKNGSYLKRTYHYAQQFMYFDGKALYGTHFTQSGTIEMINPRNAGQVCLMLAKSDGNMLRFVFEFYNNQYHIFTDKKVNGVFGEYRDLTKCGNKINYKVTYFSGRVVLEVNNSLVGDVGLSLGKVHLGIGSDNTQFRLSSLSGELFE